MARDYAKKAKSRKSASRFKKDEKKGIPAWTWLIAGLLVGIIVSFVAYLKVIKPEDTKVIAVEKETPPPSAKSRYKAVPADEADEEFKFHSELENKVVEVPKQEITSTKPKKPQRYIMQCGSFKKRASAEKLKAQIAMSSGFTASIKATKEKSGTTWHRVSLGPYDSKRSAERDRHQLERNNINNCRIW